MSLVSGAGNEYNVCRMIPCWMENSTHSINILNFFTNMIRMYSVYQALSYLIALLASGLFKLAMYSCDGLHCGSANFDEIDAGNVNCGSCDGTWYTDYNGIYFATMSKNLIELGDFLFHRCNIGQTLADEVTTILSVPWLCIYEFAGDSN